MAYPLQPPLLAGTGVVTAWAGFPAGAGSWGGVDGYWEPGRLNRPDGRRVRSLLAQQRALGWVRLAEPCDLEGKGMAAASPDF